MMTTNVACASQDEPDLDELFGPAETQTLLRAATRAPSLHNSQPWRFAVGPRHVELYVDAARQLRYADPAGRSLLISCGAALFNLRVAAEHLGFHPRVRVLPDDAAPTLVALATVDRHHPGPGALDDYYPAVSARRTNRRPFTGRLIPLSVRTALTHAAHAEGAILRVIDDSEEVSRIIRLLHSADLSEQADTARTAESRRGSAGPIVTTASRSVHWGHCLPARAQRSATSGGPWQSDATTRPSSPPPHWLSCPRVTTSQSTGCGPGRHSNACCWRRPGQEYLLLSSTSPSSRRICGGWSTPH
jgi:hypothetical protein